MCAGAHLVARQRIGITSPDNAVTLAGCGGCKKPDEQWGHDPTK